MSDRTEAPTPRRLEEARQEGRVARSQELNSAVIMLVGALLLQGPGAALIRSLESLTTSTLTGLPEIGLGQTWMQEWGYQQVVQIGPPVGIILFGLLAAGVGTTLVQTGFLWTTKKMGFDFQRVNPLSGLKRIFSGQGLVELARALFKLGLLGLVAYSFLRGKAQELLQLSQMDFLSGLEQWTSMALALALRMGSAYFVLAVVDYGYQRWRYMQSMRMTKEEIKEEIKRSEGDPFLRGRIRAQQRRIARNRMMANVKKASVVITNPTHLAVAIGYDAETMNAPRVLAKGAYAIAQRIADIARENGIPVIQNIPMARVLYRTVPIDREIPPDLYMAMAEVLAYVYRLQGQKPRLAAGSHAR